MKRTLVAVLVVVGSLATTQAADAHHKVRDPQKQCRTSEGNGWSTKDVKQAIRCAAARWHVPGGYRKLFSVARCESGFNPRARYTDHGGVFQHVFRYWPARFRHWRVRGWRMHSSIWNARSNVIVSVRMIHVGGYSPWACA